MINNALFTDFYELTMAQGFWKKNMNHKTVFDMFFRSHPFNGGYSVFAGLEPLIETITNFHFEKEDINFLKEQKIFEPEFLDYLSNYKFSGSLYAMSEGSLIFPNEPVIRIHATVIEAILIEGMLLNMVNFQSLIATKTARIWLASNKAPVLEFGMRRAQGQDGAMSASRAAFIGGATGTSNTLAGKKMGIPVLGTMAHSWIMSFDTEEESFEAFAEMYPDNATFLIDTYDSLRSGIENAIKVGKKLQAKGKNFAVRLDSGDLYYLSKDIRRKLDEAGCQNAKIVASNQLDEQIIESLVLNKSPIDSWGVGTQMVTGGDDSSFNGVYKLVARESENGEWTPVIKFSDQPEKMTTPAIKQVWRLYNNDGSFKADVITLEGETIQEGIEQTFYHPSNNYQNFKFKPAKVEQLLKIKIKNGERVCEKVPVIKIKEHLATQLEKLDYTSKRILNPHIYKVSLSKTLSELKKSLIAQKPEF